MSINISDEYMELEEGSRSRRLMLEEFDRRKRSRQIPVSLDDNEVKRQLRQLNQPICLFGEGPPDRRERLRYLLPDSREEPVKKAKEEEKPDKKDQNTTWYHEGLANLKDARFWIADYSIVRAKNRLDRERAERRLPDSHQAKARQELFSKLQSIDLAYSQVDRSSNRPFSFCRFSPNQQMIATASRGGSCKLWSQSTLDPVRNLRGHNVDCSCIVFHPGSTLIQSSTALNLASSGFDGSVRLWSLDGEEPIESLEGHGPYRVRRLEFHPSGRFLGTCCGDHSWRLWDLEKTEEILHQEGHSKEVCDIAFHVDGSLAATAGADAFGRVWDLRTGRCIMFMEGHSGALTSIAISPDGYHILTGSVDNSVKVWNLRKRACEYTIPAHKHTVSEVLFDKSQGRYLITSGHDKTLRIWSHPSWTQIKCLEGHDNAVTCCDISSDDQRIVSCSLDKTFKLWSPI